MSFQRPSTMGEAFLIASIKAKKVDHSIDTHKGTGNWVARRALINAERPGFAVVKEFDRRPKREPLSPAGYKGLVEGLEQVFIEAALHPKSN